MLALNYTQSLLNLQEVIVKKVITTKESTVKLIPKVSSRLISHRDFTMRKK